MRAARGAFELQRSLEPSVESDFVEDLRDRNPGGGDQRLGELRGLLVHDFDGQFGVLEGPVDDGDGELLVPGGVRVALRINPG